jgi:hypothetical protein
MGASAPSPIRCALEATVSEPSDTATHGCQLRWPWLKALRLESCYVPATTPAASGWSESAIEAACERAEEWFQALPVFGTRTVVGGGQVVGRRHPAILSERDCVINFARFLNEEGVPWDAIHHEVSLSRWMFDEPHPAATMMTPAQRRRRVDLALVKVEDFMGAELPALAPGFQFDAFLEFGYLSDYWKVQGARIFGGDPVKGREKVKADIEKIGIHLAAGGCGLGYVIVFEECDWGFAEEFAAEAETRHNGCRVRFVRNHDPRESGP